MGTFYSLGVIENFTATADEPYSDMDWQNFLNERIDTTLFNLTIEEGGKFISGALKKGIFEENIEDFYNRLVDITNCKSLKWYFEEDGVDINNYQTYVVKMFFYPQKNKEIKIIYNYVSLFIEGKVMVEEFSIEPKLINWLFRHCNFGNILSGCIISNITG